MRKNVRFLVCLCYFVTITRSECPDKIKYTVKTLNKNYTYDSEQFEAEVISTSGKAFSITLEGHVPVLCKKNLKITEHAYHFYASGNGIEEIEAGTFADQNINSQLRLSDNNIKIIRSGTFKNILITDLDLTNNKIRTIEEGALENLPKLSVLNLGRNKIVEFFPRSIEITPELAFFDMSHNKLEKLENRHFSFMTKDRNVGIGLAHNELIDIHPKAFKDIDIFTLNLTHNNLCTIPKEVFLNKLHYLSIAYNKLTHLDETFFELNTTILRDVELEGNNFDGETQKKLVPFMEIIEENRKRDREFHRIDDTRPVNSDII